MISRGAAPTDPVCGKPVHPETSLDKATHKGVLYSFCAAECKAAFEKTPETFVSAVEDLTPRTIVSALLSAAVLLLDVTSADRIEGLGRSSAPFQLLLTTPILFWCGAAFMRGLARGLRCLFFDADSLVGIGAGAAYGYSILATLFPRAALSAGVAPRLYFDTAAMIVTLPLFSKLLVSKLESKALSPIRDPQIGQIVREALGSKSAVPSLADRVVSVFVPAVIVVAAVTFIGWLWVGPEPALPFALNAAMSVLIIACPSALALAAPIAILVATGRAAQMGIRFRSIETLELLSGVTGLVLNKAGTLTEGRFKVTDVLSISDHDTRGLMALAASAEKASEHPAGQAIVSHAHGLGAVVHNPSEFEALPGRGVRAQVNGVVVLVGNEKLLAESGVDGGRLLDGARHLAAEGKSASFVVANGEKQGIIGMSDELRAGSVDAVARMKANGLRSVMLTGESAGVASRIGESVGFDDVLPEVAPQNKASEVEKLQKAGHKVALVGDGVHDSPAIARADVGVAIAEGPAYAIENPDVSLATDSLSSVVDAILLSRATMRIVHQNRYWAVLYNAVGIPLAAGVLYLVFGVTVSPVVAAAAMAMSSSSVVANALRLRNFEPSS